MAIVPLPAYYQVPCRTYGQALAILEDARFIQLQQDHLVARGRVDLLRMDFERQKALNAS
ncbi:MAG: hypothetical protein IT227_09595, partial [Flavobacteriales bacterium]|nr:hypothetical protein [Flavobacteriales bacterium]